MAQKTKEELKNQSKTLLESEGDEKVDWIDTFATVTDVNKVYEHIYNPEALTTVYFHRQGNLVTLSGVVEASEDIHRAGSLGIKITNGYYPGQTVLGNLLFFIDESAIQGTAMSFGKGFSFLNQTEQTIPKGEQFLINCTYYTEDSFPDDSEIINPNPIPDKK